MMNLGLPSGAAESQHASSFPPRPCWSGTPRTRGACHVAFQRWMIGEPMAQRIKSKLAWVGCHWRVLMGWWWMRTVERLMVRSDHIQIVEGAFSQRVAR